MKKIRVGIVVVSDKAAVGIRRDGCVDALREIIPRRQASVEACAIVPDDVGAIRRAVRRMVDTDGLDLVLTAGGTGLSPRDVTPEALTPLIRRSVPGIAERMRAEGFRSTPTAVLSRSIAGTRGRSLIIALPGSPRGAAECLSAVWPAIPHAIGLLRGEVEECARRTAAH